jgi:hypothetical protein
VNVEHVIGVASPGLENVTGPVGAVSPAATGIVYVNVTVPPAVIAPGVAVNVWLNTGVTPFVTGAFATVTVVGPVLVAAKLPEAGIVTVIGSLPTGNVLVVSVATQLPPVSVTGAVPIDVPLLKNVAGPAGQTPLIGASVSVKVTGVPYVVD